MSKSLSVSSEINLLGKTVDEAVAELDKYLDDAIPGSPDERAHCPRKGNRRPRATGIHNYLRRQKSTSNPFRLGAFGEGDAGVTIVELK